MEKYGYLNDDNGSTIIIFSSDNGSPHCSQCGYNYPLRGTKTTIWEGGCRLTSAVWATSNIISSKKRGTIYTQLMHVVDWYKTILDAAGIDFDSLRFNYTLDSVSQWQGLKKIENEPDDDQYFAYRDTLWYNYATGIWNKDFVGFNNTGFRYKWNKIINGSGSYKSGGDGWYKPNLEQDGNVYNVGIEMDEKYQLYDIEDDPNEYDNIMNVTGENNETFINVLNKMVQLENTMRPQMINDMNCPPFGPQNNSVVGPVYMPWC